METANGYMHRKWDNKNLLTVLILYVVLCIFSICLIIEFGGQQQVAIIANTNTTSHLTIRKVFTAIQASIGTESSLIARKVPTATQASIRNDSSLLTGKVSTKNQASINSWTFLHARNSSIPSPNVVATTMQQNTIPRINCNDSVDVEHFWSKNKFALKALFRMKDRKVRKLLNVQSITDSTSNKTLVDHFFENLCKIGTTLNRHQMKNMLIVLEGSGLIPTSSSPIIPRPETSKYYRSLPDNEIFSLHCQTCALVSSSGRIIGSNVGQEIDTHTCVIRMNNAPTLGFQRDVGNRTTVRVASFIIAQGLNKGDQEFLIGKEKTDYMLFWGLEHKAHKKFFKVLKEFVGMKHPTTKIYYQTSAGELALDKEFEMLTGYNRDKSKSWLSTGWFALKLALDMCGKIDVYGMIPDNYCSKHTSDKTRYHYYQSKNEPMECSIYKFSEQTTKSFAHRFMTEKAVFAKWAVPYNITFYHPSWSINEHSTTLIDTPFMNSKNVKKKPKILSIKIPRKH